LFSVFRIGDFSLPILSFFHLLGFSFADAMILTFFPPISYRLPIFSRWMHVSRSVPFLFALFFHLCFSFWMFGVKFPSGHKSVVLKEDPPSTNRPSLSDSFPSFSASPPPPLFLRCFLFRCCQTFPPSFSHNCSPPPSTSGLLSLLTLLPRESSPPQLQCFASFT